MSAAHDAHPEPPQEQRPTPGSAVVRTLRSASWTAGHPAPDEDDATAEQLHRLVRQLAQRVADEPDRPVPATGEARRSVDLAVTVSALEQVRVALLDHGRWLAEQAGAEARERERDRFVAEANEVVVRRLFGFGLSLQSLAAREPSLAEPLGALIREVDEVIRATRDVIFGVRPSPMP